ncbi:hypothetical protein GCM10022393_23760 [Aquimarina addita]|uniref:Efflux RND transporter periplasmic adaptor subunit n=1 Tax=Aquimarina addita TaxID=870485 RepID=A0ABP6UNX2_9FLAO
MKKYSVYLGLVAVGFFIGYLIFATKNTGKKADSILKVEQSDTQWTCAMHPQIMMPEPGDCPLCGMDLIPVDAQTEGLSTDEFRMTDNAMALANIQTTVVGGEQIGETNSLTLTGKIVENADATATQPAHFNGRIEKLYVTSLGEEVRRGQAIAQIYAPELVAAQQELLTAYKTRASQPALYNAVKNKFKNWKITEKQLEEIEKTREIKTNLTVFSHVSGVITEILVNEGAHIMDGYPIFKVSNLNTVWASFDMYENQISQVEKGQKLIIRTNAYPDKEIDAVISFIDPIVNTTTRTISIRAVLDNKKSIFKPGMFVEGIVVGINNKSEGSISIPKSAVLWTGERSVVYVKKQGAPIFEMKEVMLGNSERDMYQILEGLNIGDEIVTNGTFTVDAAAQLQGKKSMMHQDKNKWSGSNIDDKNQNVSLKLPEGFQHSLVKILPTYFLLKEELLSADIAGVVDFSEKMERQMDALKTPDVGKAEKELVDKSIQVLKALVKNKSLKEQQLNFISLNEYLITLVKNIDNIAHPLYVQKCPMVHTNGASWLSEEKEIRNPYFGGNMIACGSVIDTLRTH